MGTPCAEIKEEEEEEATYVLRRREDQTRSLGSSVSAGDALNLAPEPKAQLETRHHGWVGEGEVQSKCANTGETNRKSRVSSIQPLSPLLITLAAGTSSYTEEHQPSSDLLVPLSGSQPAELTAEIHNASTVAKASKGIKEETAFSSSMFLFCNTSPLRNSFRFMQPLTTCYCTEYDVIIPSLSPYYVHTCTPRHSAD